MAVFNKTVNDILCLSFTWQSLVQESSRHKPPVTLPLQFLAPASESLDGGYPCWDWTGVHPLPIRTGWGIIPVGTGLVYTPPPPSGLDGDTLLLVLDGDFPNRDWMGYPSIEIRRQSRYAAGSMLLAFTQEDFLVFHFLNHIFSENLNDLEYYEIQFSIFL